MIFLPFDVQWLAHLVGPRGSGKTTLIELFKAAIFELLGETTLADTCSRDAEMRRRTNGAIIDSNIVFVDECEVPEVPTKGEPTQQFETENILQFGSTRCLGVEGFGV